MSQLGIKLPFQNNILLAKGFVAKANQTFGFIQYKAVFNMLFLRVKWCDVKVWQKFFTICQCTEAAAHKKFPILLFFDTYRSFFCNFYMHYWLHCCFGNLILICAKFIFTLLLWIKTLFWVTKPTQKIPHYFLTFEHIFRTIL